MQEIAIYIATDSATPSRSLKKYGYVLECMVNGEPITRTGFGEVEATYHGATLTAMLEALNRVKVSCMINIHAEDVFVLNMLENNLPKWAAEGFCNGSGKPVANGEIWQEIWKMAVKHMIKPEKGKHEYSSWLKREMQNENDRL